MNKDIEDEVKVDENDNQKDVVGKILMFE